ncbi:MAG TPA: metallopeptidase family protein [Candidatus Paceibacterota bacterium]|nr:metallopeptidase family protein [Candidatus Paceibacterota bacterium]
MTAQEFEILVAEEFPGAVPEKFRAQIENVAFLVEEQPSADLRREEGLGPHETLLGHYRGIPHTSRGDWYGVGGTLPDTITLYRLPIEMEAQELAQRLNLSEEESVRKVIRETIWHEVAHHFGMDEREVRERESEMGF